MQEAINLKPAPTVDRFSNCSIQSVPTVASCPELSLLQSKMFLPVHRTSTNHILTRLEGVQPYSTIESLACVQSVPGIQGVPGIQSVPGRQGVPGRQSVPDRQGVLDIQGVLREH